MIPTESQVYTVVYARCVHIWFVHNSDHRCILFSLPLYMWSAYRWAYSYLFMFHQLAYSYVFMLSPLTHLYVFMPLQCDLCLFICSPPTACLYTPSTCSCMNIFTRQLAHSYLFVPHQFAHHPYDIALWFDVYPCMDDYAHPLSAHAWISLPFWLTVYM